MSEVADTRKARWARFCGWVLKKMGWTRVGGPVPEKKALLLGVPHTSLWDFVVSYFFYTSYGKQKARVIVKRELFFWPLGGLLRRMGGIPVDRTNATTLVRSLISEMEKRDEFILAIAPEGTRKPVKRWKTGFHTIAKETGVPVYLAYFDWGTKRISCGEKFPLSDNPRADMEKIQQIYEDMHVRGKHPERFVTH